VVEERSWISEQDYVEGLGFAQLSRRPNDAMESNKFPLRWNLRRLVWSN